MGVWGQGLVAAGAWLLVLLWAARKELGVLFPRSFWRELFN